MAMNGARAISLLAWLVAFSAALFSVHAQDKPAPLAPPAVREIAPGILQVGTVRLEKKSRTISFPAELNISEGLIEYLLVTTTGKTHESLLKTEAQPHHIHVAMLLLGAKGAGAKPLTNAPAGGNITPEQLAKFRDQPLAGEPVTIELSWQVAGVEKRARIEELVLNRKAKAPMSKGDFTFNGSQIWQGTYIAQQEGSIISVITDPDAVFNNPRPGRDHDDNWEVISKVSPPLGTKVQVFIKLGEQPTKPK